MRYFHIVTNSIKKTEQEKMMETNFPKIPAPVCSKNVQLILSENKLVFIFSYNSKCYIVNYIILTETQLKRIFKLLEFGTLKHTFWVLKSSIEKIKSCRIFIKRKNTF